MKGNQFIVYHDNQQRALPDVHKAINKNEVHIGKSLVYF